jgi:hypothetical protein
MEVTQEEAARRVLSLIVATATQKLSRGVLSPQRIEENNGGRVGSGRRVEASEAARKRLGMKIVLVGAVYM